MKKEILLLITAVFFLGTAALRSQNAVKDPMQMLQNLKKANADLIEQQKKTLDTLDEMQKTADEIKAFGKRG